MSCVPTEGEGYIGLKVRVNHFFCAGGDLTLFESHA